uniref:Uncharacterized protein n=1 Tax=Arundo donax TaxID=35708 RepID=A0A0A9ABC9_ARUDO
MDLNPTVGLKCGDAVHSNAFFRTQALVWR